jgi:hypothetical protein
MLFAMSLPSCAQNKQLNIGEVCFTRYNEINEIELVCYRPDGTDYRRYGSDADKYTCFNTKEAAKLSSFVDKCLKEGVKP